MRKVTYANGEFTTSDAVASILLEYGAALANRGRAATLFVPTLGADRGDEVELLVGPASQLSSQPIEGEQQLQNEQRFVDHVRAEVDKLTASPTTYPDWDPEI